MANFDDIVLSVRNLTIDRDRRQGARALVRDVSFDLNRGEFLGLVGESGSGKSLTLRSIIDILPRGTRRIAGEFRMNRNGAGLAPYDAASIRGTGIGMIFQEPQRSLNPIMRVGSVIVEPLRQHLRISRAMALVRARRLLDEVGILDVERVIDAYPHQLSGGMRQRVMIAAALACQPEVLLCDEPTTSLDVTTQAQIIEVLSKLRVARGLSIIFVSHDLAVVAQIANRVAVMYAGELAELGPTGDVLTSPAHPYTHQLIGAVPSVHGDGSQLAAIPGMAPTPDVSLEGCSFAPRCFMARDDCHDYPPEITRVADDRLSRCRYANELIRDGASR